MLAELVGDARIVLIGSSHGTHEFYQAQAAMTRWLIEEKGFWCGSRRGGLARRLPGQSVFAASARTPTLTGA